MAFKLNPVKAVCMKYDCQDQGIQGLNTDCFGICASFSGTYDTFEMDPACVKSCTDLIEKRKKEIFGVGSCDHQTPLRPVDWQQVPSFIPQLLKKGVPLEKSLQLCSQLCANTSLPEECKDKCLLDFNAVEPFEKTVKVNMPVKSKSESNNKIIKADYWILGSVLLVLIILLTVYLIKKRY